MGRSQSAKKQCNAWSGSFVDECRHIKYLLSSLQQFKSDHFIVKPFKYDLCQLLGAYDHILTKQHFTKQKVEEKEENESIFSVIEEYAVETMGYCEKKECDVMHRHRMRVRERNKNEKNEKKEDEESGDDNLKEIICSILNALHCHILHSDKHLFRLEKTEDDSLHFITSQTAENEENEKKKSDFIKIEFGQSVLEWLRFDEKPQFESFHEEIINNEASTISGPLFLQYAQECSIKLIAR